MTTSLNLSEFVSATIVEIAKGVEYAKENLKDSDVLINPVTDTLGRAMTDRKGVVRQIQNIEFDLMVSVSNKDSKTEEDKKVVGGKIQVVSIISSALGANQSKVSTEDAEFNSAMTNRIKFSIPLSFGTNTAFEKSNSSTPICF